MVLLLFSMAGKAASNQMPTDTVGLSLRFRQANKLLQQTCLAEKSSHLL
jgi:hypothetical protein